MPDTRFHYLAVDSPARPRLLYAADTGAHVVRVRGSSGGRWRVLAGRQGRPGYFDGPGALALFNHPAALCVMPHGVLAVADAGNACVRSIAPSGAVATLAGRCTRPGAADGTGSEASFSHSLKSIVCLANCSVLVADGSNGRLRLLAAADAACLRAAAAALPSPWTPFFLLAGKAACGLALALALALALLLLLAALANRAWASAIRDQIAALRTRHSDGLDHVSQGVLFLSACLPALPPFHPLPADRPSRLPGLCARDPCCPQTQMSRRQVYQAIAGRRLRPPARKRRPPPPPLLDVPGCRDWSSSSGSSSRAAEAAPSLPPRNVWTEGGVGPRSLLDADVPAPPADALVDLPPLTPPAMDLATSLVHRGTHQRACAAAPAPLDPLAALSPLPPSLI